jgi:SAM-dependent methyltransferase
MTEPTRNIDERTVDGFGAEWSRFRQDALPDEERRRIFDAYFRGFPWHRLPAGAVGADFGCGSGRWAALVAPRVGHLHLVDASAAALAVARENLAGVTNVDFIHSTVDDAPLADGSLDFAYSLGVLHHIPDTARALAHVARRLKPGAPLLVYLYYAFDNRPAWYRALWRSTDAVRRVVSRLPHGLRHASADAIALAVYLPLARSARALERIGHLPPSWPLALYRDKSFYTMRTDALDRFGTRLEQRFTRAAIERMMSDAGLVDVRFSPGEPYWVAVGTRAG